MKQLLPLIVILTLFAVANNANGQTDNAVAFNFKKAVAVSNSSTSKINRSSVNFRALKDFEKSFQEVSDEKWFKLPGGVIANFLSKGIDFRIAYNEKGKWLYNLLSYPEDNLPSEIRKMVRSQYYDYVIQFCNEYQLPQARVYIIKIQDDKTIKTLRIADDEMEVIKDEKRG